MKKWWMFMIETLRALVSREKLKKTFKSICEFVFNPPLLICFGIAWLITNGWSYITLALGVYFDIPVMVGIASAYLAILWVPFTPEKLITVIISIALLKHFFPNDEKTLKKLEGWYAKYQIKKKDWKEHRQEERQERKNQNR